MKKRGFLNLFAVAALSIAAGTLYSCKDYDDEMFHELKGQVEDQDASLGELIDKQESNLNQVKDSLGTAQKELANKQTELEKKVEDCLTSKDADDKFATQEALDELEKTVSELSEVTGRIVTIEEKIALIDGVLAKKADKEEVAALKGDVDALLKWMGQMQSVEYATKEDLRLMGVAFDGKLDSLTNKVFTPKFNELFDSLATVNSKAVDNANKIAAHDSILNGLKDKVASHEKFAARIDSLSGEVNGLKKGVEEAKSLADANLNKANLYTDSLMAIVAADFKKYQESVEDKFGNIDSTFNAFDAKFVDLENGYKDADKVLADSISALQTKIATLKTQVDKNTEDIAILNNKFDNVMSEMITSLAVNGAYSPVLGYFSLPTGLKSNVLSAFYGEAMDDVYFPSTRRGDYLDEKQAFTARERELLGFKDDENGGQAAFVGGQIVVEDGVQNAGKLYVTVNPNSVNMNGKTFALYNSLGEEASVKLGKAVRSNDKLTFGYNRAAGVQNGFYEIPASLSAEGVANAKLRLEFEDLKAAVKDVLTPDDGVDITNVATTLYAAVNDLADAQAVAATWTDARGEHSVLSDYGIAAVAVKPLSYEFMKDFHRDNFWGIDKAYSLLDKIIGEANKITDKIVDIFPEFNLNVPQIDTIKIEALDSNLLAEFKIVYNDTIRETIVFEDNIVIDQMVSIDDVWVPEQNVPIEGQTITVPIKITKPIDVTIPAKQIKVDNPAKLKPGQAGYEPEVHDPMEDSIVVEIPETTVTQTIEIDQTQDVYVDGKTVTVEGQYIHINDVHIHVEKPIRIEKEIQVPVFFEKDMSGAVEDLYGSMTGSIQDVNKMLVDLKQFINVDLNNLLQELNGMGSNIQTELDQAIEEVRGKLASLIEKVDNKLCQIVNSVHSKLQPAMFVKGVDSFVMLSSAKNAPLAVPSQFVLAPTTYTAELLTPAAKKFVAVTDVIKGAESAKAGNSKLEGVLKEANDENVNLNNVFPGYVQGIKVENLKSGYTYEFTYSALDFHGKIVNTKYYVTVK